MWEPRGRGEDWGGLTRAPLSEGGTATQLQQKGEPKAARSLQSFPELETWLVDLSPDF